MKMYNNIYKKTIFRLFILIQLFFLLFFFTSCSSSLSTAEIYNQSIAKVVEIRTTNNNVDYSYASGCFIDKNKIVTNKHVVYNPTTSQNWIHIEYRKYNETNYTEASIEKVYTNSDLATLSVINGNSYFKINERCSVANVCYSIGNPNNLGLSFNSGIVSAFSNITIDGLINKMIQTNIPLNHGNSGGALINKNGQLIGITTLRLKDINNDLLQGLSYSIPVEYI